MWPQPPRCPLMFCPDPNSVHSLNPARLLEMPDSPCPPLTLNFSLASRDPHLKSGSGALSWGLVWAGLQALSPPCLLPSQPFAHATCCAWILLCFIFTWLCMYFPQPPPQPPCHILPKHRTLFPQSTPLGLHIDLQVRYLYLFIQHVFMEHLLRAKHCPSSWGQSIVNRRDLPGSSAIRTLYFQCMACVFEPWSRN